MYEKKREMYGTVMLHSPQSPYNPHPTHNNIMVNHPTHVYLQSINRQGKVCMCTQLTFQTGDKMVKHIHIHTPCQSPVMGEMLWHTAY